MIFDNVRLVDYYEAYNMAVQLFIETEGVNSFSPTEWIEYENINIAEKISIPSRVTLLHEYIKSVYLFHQYYMIDKHFSEELIESVFSVIDTYEYSNSVIEKLRQDFNKYKYEGEDADYSDFDGLGYLLMEELKKELVDVIVEDIFNVLYQNKAFLKKFNLSIKEIVDTLKFEAFSEILEKNGVVKRAKYLPVWLKNGVYYRDRGRCQICGKDMSGLLRTDKVIHYDHIIPLEQGGTNDPTNYQLTCSDCNLSKGDRSFVSKDIASPFWTTKE